jgi:hypothetical protein
MKEFSISTYVREIEENNLLINTNCSSYQLTLAFNSAFCCSSKAHLFFSSSMKLVGLC